MLYRKKSKSSIFGKNFYSFNYRSKKFNSILKYYFVKSSEIGGWISPLGPGYGIKDNNKIYHHSRFLAYILIYPISMYLIIVIPFLSYYLIYGIIINNTINPIFYLILLIIHISFLFNLPRILSLLIKLKPFRKIMEVFCRSEYINH